MSRPRSAIHVAADGAGWARRVRHIASLLRPASWSMTARGRIPE
jgi:hypothetical protein